MKIALLYSLLIYQLIQDCDSTANCTSLSTIRAGSTQADIPVNRGGSAKLIPSRVNYCIDPNNDDYVLLHENHDTGELDVVLQQSSYRFILSDIQLTTAGIYCTYQQCATEEEPQCCIKIKVLPEVKIILPNPVYDNAQQPGVCYAEAWPLPETNDINVFTDGICAITKGPLSKIDNYTAAIFFTLHNINSSCQDVICSTQSDTKTKPVRMSPTHVPTDSIPDIPTDSIPDIPTSKPTGDKYSNTTDPCLECNCECPCSGVLEIYRINLWIIVLILTILSTVVTR